MMMEKKKCLLDRTLFFGMIFGISLLASSAMADNSAIVPVSRDQAGWLARHQSMSDRLKEGHADVLWIGDSIVERWEKQGKSVWKKYYGDRNAVNLGISGDRTEHVLWRLDNCNLEKVSPKLAIVMIGQNNGGDNSAEEIAEGVTAIVNKLRQKLPKMNILLLGIFYRGEKPNEEQIKLAKTNDIISGLADDEDIFYMNINQIFLLPDGTIQKSLMPDFEHPNRKGCQVWAEAIEPKVAALLGDSIHGSTQPTSPKAGS